MIRVHVLYATPGKAWTGTGRCDTIIAEGLGEAVKAATDLARLRMSSAGLKKISAHMYDDAHTILFYRNEALAEPPPGKIVKSLMVTKNSVVMEPPDE